MAKQAGALSMALRRARQERKPFVIHQSRNGQWMFCSSEYYTEHKSRLRNAHAVHPNGDCHALDDEMVI